MLLISPSNPVIRRDLAVTWRIIAPPEQGNGDFAARHFGAKARILWKTEDDEEEADRV